MNLKEKLEELKKKKITITVLVWPTEHSGTPYHDFTIEEVGDDYIIIAKHSITGNDRLLIPILSNVFFEFEGKKIRNK